MYERRGTDDSSEQGRKNVKFTFHTVNAVSTIQLQIWLETAPRLSWEAGSGESLECPEREISVSRRDLAHGGRKGHMFQCNIVLLSRQLMCKSHPVKPRSSPPPSPPPSQALGCFAQPLVTEAPSFLLRAVSPTHPQSGQAPPGQREARGRAAASPAGGKPAQLTPGCLHRGAKLFFFSGRLDPLSPPPRALSPLPNPPVWRLDGMLRT